MRTLIAETDHYSIEIDAGKNRAYLSFAGFCKSTDEMSTYLDDVAKAGRQLKKGFTLLTNATQLKTPTPEVSALHEKSQKLWIESGLSKTAEIVPDTATAQIALNRYSKTTGMKKKAFSQEKRQRPGWIPMMNDPSDV